MKYSEIFESEFDDMKKADEIIGHFKNEINDQIKTQNLGNNSVWNYIETPKGKSTVQIKDIYPTKTIPTAELFWLLAMNRGAGREAMQLICNLADKHGVYLQLEAVPLNNAQNGKEFKLSLPQLIKFYESFGFEIKENTKYPLMVRKPIEKITEAPIGQYDVIPTVSHEKGQYGIGSFRPNELKAANNPKWIEKVHNFFKNCPYAFNVYIYDGPEKYRNLKHKRGYYTAENIRNFFEITPPNSNKSINVVMTNNDGAERFPLTPWILCHRIVHAFFDGDPFQSTFNPMKEVANDYLNTGTNFLYALNKAATSLSKELSEKDAFDELVSKISNFKSARDKKLVSSGEYLIELFTQYILEGKVTFNKLYDYSYLENDKYYELFKQYDYAKNFVAACIKKSKKKVVYGSDEYYKLFEKYAALWTKYRDITHSIEFNFQSNLDLYENRFNEKIKAVLDVAVGKYFLL